MLLPTRGANKGGMGYTDKLKGRFADYSLLRSLFGNPAIHFMDPQFCVAGLPRFCSYRRDIYLANFFFNDLS